MSASIDLQNALIALLLADYGVAAIVGDAVYDGDAEKYPCITFGPTSMAPNDADCITAGTETVQIDCWVRDGARLWKTKDLASAVKSALHGKTADLQTHALVSLDVTLVQCFMDRDGLTGHGVVQVEAEIEER